MVLYNYKRNIKIINEIKKGAITMPTMTPEYREYVLERIQESKKENMTIEKCQEELKMKQARYETLISRSSIADKIYARNSVQSSIFYWECVIEVLTELAEQEQELEPVAEVVPVNPVRKNTCSYNRVAIMKRAWEIKKEHKENVFSLCLKMAWKEAKYTIASLEIGDTIEIEYGDYGNFMNVTVTSVIKKSMCYDFVNYKTYYVVKSYKFTLWIVQTPEYRESFTIALKRVISWNP